MSTRYKKHLFLRALVVPSLSVAVLAYFGYHLMHGAYGIRGLERVRERIAKLETELTHVQATRQALALRVALLRPNNADMDMVEERARQSLYLTHPDDVVIFTPWRQRWQNATAGSADDDKSEHRRVP